MACGVHLGILLICLLQAEHVRCLWAAQAQSPSRQNGNKYAGFSQQESEQGRLGSSYPQNQLRPASAQSSSFNTDSAGSSSTYSPGLSSRGHTNALSQPKRSGSTVKFVKSSLLSKPTRRVTKPSQPAVPNRRSFGLSTAIASGSSVSQYSKSPSALDISKKRTWPSQQGTLRASKYVSSSSASVQGPSRKSTAASVHSAAHRAPSAATSTKYGQRGSSAVSYSTVKSSSLFGAAAPAPQSSVQMKTSATGPARRVSSRRSSQASKPSSVSYRKNERTVSYPSQAEAGSGYKSHLFQVAGGSDKPTSTSNYASYSQSPSNKENAPFQPRSSTSQRSSYKPSYTSSSTSSLQASRNSRTSVQGSRNVPASKASSSGASGLKYAPTRTYDIPERFGGYAIRRLKDPDDQKVSISKPQKTYTPPSRQSSSFKPQVHKVHEPSKRRHQQTYVSPSQPTYTAPSQQRSSPKPQAQSVHQESKWKRVRPAGKLSSASITG